MFCRSLGLCCSAVLSEVAGKRTRIGRTPNRHSPKTLRKSSLARHCRAMLLLNQVLSIFCMQDEAVLHADRLGHALKEHHALFLISVWSEPVQAADALCVSLQGRPCPPSVQPELFHNGAETPRGEEHCAPRWPIREVGEPHAIPSHSVTPEPR